MEQDIESKRVKERKDSKEKEEGKVFNCHGRSVLSHRGVCGSMRETRQLEIRRVLKSFDCKVGECECT